MEDVFDDSLSFHTELLSELSDSWRRMVSEEIAHCDELASTVAILYEHILRAGGKTFKDEKKSKERVRLAEQCKSLLYGRLDMPFREWLMSLDPDGQLDRDEAMLQWRMQAKQIATRLGQEIVDQAGDAALVGRAIKKDDKTFYYAAPRAYDKFLADINKIYED